MYRLSDLKALIQATWALGLPMLGLQGAGLVKRLGRVWYIDCQFGSPAPTNGIQLDQDPPDNLEAALVSLKNGLILVQPNVDVDIVKLQAQLTTLEQKIQALEAKV